MARFSALAALFALLTLPCAAYAGHERDYINTDDEGHVIFRYAGSQSPTLTPEQLEEITNAFFSVMVHDLHRADLLFDMEARDQAWDAPLERSIEHYLDATALNATDIRAECHPASCRLWVMQSGPWTVEDHQRLMDTLQTELQGFMRDSPGRFDPVFLVTAYYQVAETPHIKAFLERADLTP